MLIFRLVFVPRQTNTREVPDFDAHRGRQRLSLDLLGCSNVMSSVPEPAIIRPGLNAGYF
jgi:hypothetical protein